MSSHPGLSRERLIECLSYDPITGEFFWKINRFKAKIGKRAGCTHKKEGYVLITIDYITYFAHRLAWLYVYSEYGVTLDHINGNRADNRIENLRKASPAENSQNRKLNKNNTSGYKGVCWVTSKQRWLAMITCHHKKYNLGLFSTKEEAYEAYCKASKQLHGAFSNV